MATQLRVIDYSSLKQRVIDEAERDDIGSQVEAFIYEAEAEMWQDLRLRVMQRRYTTLTQDSRYITLPDRYLDMYRVYIMSNGKPKNLIPASPAELLAKYGSGQGIPDYFGVTGLEVEFERNPGKDNEVEMTFYQAPYNLGYQAGQAELGTSPAKIPPDELDENNVVISNKVLKLFPHIYVYGTLIKVGLWTSDQEMVLKYNNVYDMAVAKANRNAREGRVTGGPLSPLNRVGSP